ncbi:MAG: amidase family protein, partial [Ktedonobacteraceae bacterium]
DAGVLARAAQNLIEDPARRLAMGHAGRLRAAELFSAERIVPQYEALYRPRTAAAIREGQTVDAETLTQARAGRIQLRSELASLMSQHGIDIWVAPAAPGPAPEGIQTTGNPIMNLPWTYAGLPALSLPAGHAQHGLPLGLQCIGAFMADEQLVAWAEDLAETLAPSH